MRTKPIIRHAKKEDLEDMVGLLRELFAIEKDFIFHKERQGKGLSMMLEKPDDRCVMVAQMDKSVVGMCTAQLTVSTAQGGLSAMIEDMIVSADFHKMGIGQKLLRKVQSWAISQGATRLQLLADKTNRAGINFYLKHGWEPTRMICFRKTSDPCG